MIVSIVVFPEPAHFVEGVCHASDRRQSAGFFSCPSASVHRGCHPLCRLTCGLDWRDPPARQPLRASLGACALFGTATVSFLRHSGLVHDGSGWGAGSLWNSSASALCGALLFVRNAAAGLTGFRQAQLWLSLSRICPKFRAGLTPVDEFMREAIPRACASPVQDCSVSGSPDPEGEGR